MSSLAVELQEIEFLVIDADVRLVLPNHSIAEPLRGIELIDRFLQLLRIEPKLLGQALNGIALLRFLVCGVVDPTRSESFHDGAVGDTRSLSAEALAKYGRGLTNMIFGSGLLPVSKLRKLMPCVNLPRQVSSAIISNVANRLLGSATPLARDNSLTVDSPHRKTAWSA